jgi:hypothetical protein
MYYGTLKPVAFEEYLEVDLLPFQYFSKLLALFAMTLGYFAISNNNYRRFHRSRQHQVVGLA